MLTVPTLQVVEYLQRYLTANKARGMAAELALDAEIIQSEPLTVSKVLSGGWLLAPQGDNLHRFRHFISSLCCSVSG